MDSIPMVIITGQVVSSLLGSDVFQEVDITGSVEAFIKPGTSLESQLEILEKEIMKTALLRNRYNISKTASELKLSRQTLYNKLKKYSLL